MCGIFTQMFGWSDVVRFSDLIGRPVDDRTDTVRPVHFANVVTLDADGNCVVRRMRWGLIDPGVSDPIKAKKHIHARGETVDVLPAFAESFRERRGLLFVSTFNEGKEITATKTEQYVFTPLDGGPIAIAVVWNRWAGPSGSELLTFAMVTTPPNEIVATITDRMPALLPEADHAKWLGEKPSSVSALKAMLRPSDRPLKMEKAATRKPPPPKRPQTPDPQMDLF